MVGDRALPSITAAGTVVCAREGIMRLSRVLLATSVVLALALVPAVPASAADQITWPQVQAATQASQASVTQGGGTVTVAVTAKISYRQVTDYRPGGAVTRERYREAGMADSEPDQVTWTIARSGAASSYQPMPPLPKMGRYPTLRKATWVHVSPPAVSGITPPILQLMTFDPLGEISLIPANDAGTIAASWTHGVEGKPDSAVTATFTVTQAGALVLQSFSTKDLFPTGPGSTLDVQIDFANPHLVVPNFGSALPSGYVKSAMEAAQDTTMAFYAVRNAANSARGKTGTMTRPQLIAYVRSEVAANEDFAHPPANPSTDVIVNVPGGLRLTNPNAYSGQSTTWTITVTPNKKVVMTKRTKPSKVTAAP
jgi:hypothetical protein